MIYALLVFSIINIFLFFAVAVLSVSEKEVRIVALSLGIMQVFNAAYLFMQTQ